MTIKEFNTIRSAAYAAADKIPEIHAALESGEALVYDVREGNRHEIITLTRRSQMNSNTLTAHGFTDGAGVALVMKLDRATKCATF